MGDIADLERQAAAGDTDAMFDLASALAQDGDVDQAATWFERALNRGNPRAMHASILRARETGDAAKEERVWTLAAGVMAGFGVHLWQDGDREVLDEWVARCAAIGDATALRMLGEQTRAAGENDLGTDLLGRAAALGDWVAMLHLGGDARQAGDVRGARTWWRQAADRDSAEAMIYLGRLDEDAGDIAAARAWWEKAAGLGDLHEVQALYLLARSARVDGDLDSMKRWYAKAMDVGFFVPVMPTPMVTDLIGIAVDAGDVDKARYWFGEIKRRSTYDNDAEAQAIVNRLAANSADAVALFGCDLQHLVDGAVDTRDA